MFKGGAGSVAEFTREGSSPIPIAAPVIYHAVDPLLRTWWAGRSGE